MNDYQPLTRLPVDIQSAWGARLEQAAPTAEGVYRLVAARPTEAAGFEGQRITVLVLDENGVAMPSIKVAFSFSTADFYTLNPDFQWIPPTPQRAFITRTEGSGQIDQIQGGGVKPGEPGGVTVYIFEQRYSSDVVTGAGMLADHTGLHLTFRLYRAGVKSAEERLSALEAWVTNFDEQLKALKGKRGKSP